MDDALLSLEHLQVLQPSLLAVAVAAAVLLWLAFVPSRAHRFAASLPRASSALPLLGDTLTAMFAHRRTLHTWLYHECQRFQGRPFVVRILTKPPMVVLSTVHAMEDVLKTHFDKFVKGYEFTEALRDLFGHGIFVTDGATWHRQRKTASHLFSLHMMRDIMDAVMVEHTAQLCDIVGHAAEQGDAIDIKHLLELFTTDVFTKIGFGVDLRFMTSDQHEFFERFGRVNHNLLYRQERPMALWKLQNWLGLGLEKRQKEDLAWLDKFVYKIIEDSIARKAAEGAGNTAAANKDLIRLFLDHPSTTNSAGEPEYDVTEIRDMAMAFISAGRDTTAYGMAWFVVMMAQHPDIQERIRQELREKVPQLVAGEIKAPNKEQTANLVYLEAAIKESLRLNPVIPLNTREASADVVLSDGTFLAKGTQVLLPAYAMARMPSVWGPDAATFNPDRWVDAESGRLLAISPFQFLTFSAGPRVCLGRQFSIMEMKIALAALLSKFHIATDKDPREFEYDASLTLGVDGPILMRPTFV